MVAAGEWESAEHFQQFLAIPELQAFIGSVRAAPTPPAMIIAEAVPSPHEYLTSGRRAAPGTPPGGRIISGRPLSKASGKRADRPGEAPPSWLFAS